jgi:hypothetical protein
MVLKYQVKNTSLRNSIMTKRKAFFFSVFTLALISSVFAVSIMLSSCSQSANPSSPGNQSIVQTQGQLLTGTPHRDHKGSGNTQSVTETITNNTPEGMVVRIYMGYPYGYQDCSVPVGVSSTDYTLPSGAIGVSVNGTNVPATTWTVVTLPDNTQVKVYWDGLIVVTDTLEMN